MDGWVLDKRWDNNIVKAEIQRYENMANRGNVSFVFGALGTISTKLSASQDAFEIDITGSTQVAARLGIVHVLPKLLCRS